MSQKPKIEVTASNVERRIKKFTYTDEDVIIVKKNNTEFIDLSLVEMVLLNEDDSCLNFKILPIKYLDGVRTPRLPRKHSKQTKLQQDTNFVFLHAFSEITDYFSQTDKYKVELLIYKGKDNLGKGDLDNYCKAVLDAITSTKKVWKDDGQVDEIYVKRHYINDNPSYMELIIRKLKT